VKAFDLVKEKLSPQLERGLILVTKVLQNVANMQLFQKEPYMQDLNPFIQTNLPLIESLFDKYAQIPPNAVRAQVTTSEAQRREDLGTLHRHLHANIEQLSKTLREWKSMSTDNDYSVNVQTLEARLRQVLAKLGPPPEKGTYRTDLATGLNKGDALNEPYIAFLKQMEGTNIDSLREKRIFYKQGQNKEGVAMFYYIAHRYQPNMNHDAFLYLVLKTLEPHLDKPFALVIDATGFDYEHEYDRRSLRKLVSHLPYSAEKHFRAVYIVHPSKVLKDYINRVSSIHLHYLHYLHFLTRTSFFYVVSVSLSSQFEKVVCGSLCVLFDVLLSSPSLLPLPLSLFFFSFTTCTYRLYFQECEEIGICFVRARLSRQS
jgi:hypothetical protein